MKRRILVIGPNDSADRITLVAQALAAKRPHLSPTAPAEILGGEQHWLPAYQQVLRYAAAIVCVPCPDATIGSGTLRDLVQAYEAAVPVRVVCPRGRLLRLEAAGLEIIRKPRTNERCKSGRSEPPGFPGTRGCCSRCSEYGVPATDDARGVLMGPHGCWGAWGSSSVHARH